MEAVKSAPDLQTGFADLAKLSNVANALAFESEKVGSDIAILQIDNAGEWLIK